MPEWHFFAFDPIAVANSILTPAQVAARNRDLAAWQKVFDILSGTHFQPHLSPSGNCHVLPYSLVDGIVAPRFAISRDIIPNESDFGLRRTLQTFIEFVSPLSIQSTRVKLRNMIMNLIPWEAVLTSQEERDEMQLFQKTILVRGKKLPDPFWCLESSDAADTNYANAESVARMAQVESTVGLFRRLARRTDLDEYPRYVAPELATAGLLIELAATRGYGLYFREDGT